MRHGCRKWGFLISREAEMTRWLNRKLSTKNRDVRKKILRKKSVDGIVFDKFSTLPQETFKFRVMSRKFSVKKRYRLSPYAHLYDHPYVFYDFLKNDLYF